MSSKLNLINSLLILFNILYGHDHKFLMCPNFETQIQVLFKLLFTLFPKHTEKVPRGTFLLLLNKGEFVLILDLNFYYNF